MQEFAEENDFDMTDEFSPPPAKRRLVVSPWRNMSEFKEVMEWIYGEDSNTTSRERAVHQMELWAIHRRAQCPAAVYATKILLEVLLKQEGSSLSLKDLQSLHAFALVRFFNYMSSTLQTHNMRTMYQTAMGLGLPTFVVDIRHVCAHGTNLPELDLLKRTTEFCLDWLKTYYWVAQAETMLDADHLAVIENNKDKSKFMETAKLLFEVYDSAFLCHVKGAISLKECKSLISARRVANLKQFYSNEKTFRDILDDVVTEMFRLSRSDLSKKDMPEIFVSLMLQMKNVYQIQDFCDNDDYLEMLIDAVHGMFRFAFVYGIIQEYFLRLLQELEDSEFTLDRSQGIRFWAKHLAIAFNAYQKCKSIQASNPTYPEVPWHEIDHKKLNLQKLKHEKERTLYVFSGIHTKKTLIIADHFTRPWVFSFPREFLEKRLSKVNKYSAPIVQLIFPLVHPKLTATSIENLKGVIGIYLAEPQTLKSRKKNGDHSEDKIFTVDDLPKKIRNVQIAEKQYGLWNLVQDDGYDWSKCPLGRLPWQ